MCGIAGIISRDKNEINPGRLRAMTDSVAHRGPDGQGHWIDDTGEVGLGHRRLSIIDLSESAGQPMHFANRYSIVYNGEIYNYIELKDLLCKKGYVFKTESDTEVLLALYDLKKEDCLALLDGMFSFALYDRQTREIFMARDRFGEKPFFYSYVPGKYFLFGSEMKCLWAAGIRKDVNNRMLFNFLNAGALQDPQDNTATFYEHCLRLPHGHFGKLTVEDCRLSLTKYYDIEPWVINHAITENQACEKFRELFYVSLSRRLRSDVPVGSSLSGGLDSSLVVCAIDELTKGSNQKQNTFSAVFPGFAKDERQYMEKVFNNTNVIPHFVNPQVDGFINDLEKLLQYQEEPFGSASIYIQYCVMQLAAENGVNVLLDGQGADEYLAGYHSYFSQYFNDLRKNYPGKSRQQYKDYRLLQAGNPINPLVKKDLRHLLRSRFPGLLSSAKTVLNDYSQKRTPFFSNEFYEHHFQKNVAPENHLKDLNSALYHSVYEGDLQHLLRYSDRNSMAHSREVRLPFLNHELVEFVFSLPPWFKMNGGWTKWIMRKSFEDLLPAEIAWRKDKIGYEPPQKKWFENARMRDLIWENKARLYRERVIGRKEYERKKEDRMFMDGRQKSWAILMAGSLFS